MEIEGTDSGKGIERRRFLQQTATVAFAAPVIASMMAGTATAQELSCGTKSSEELGNTDCLVTTPCTSPLECRAAPTGPGGIPPIGTPCGCFVV